MYTIIPYNKSSIFLLPQIYEIEKRSFKTPWNTDQLYDELYNNHCFSFILLKNKREVIGYIFTLKVEDTTQINKLCIKEEFRMSGFGFRFLNTYIRESRRYKVNRIYLEVNENNKSAVGLYNKLGFKILRTRNNIFENSEDGFEMMLNLIDYTESPLTFSIVQFP